jgi:hypothetical protein
MVRLEKLPRLWERYNNAHAHRKKQQAHLIAQVRLHVSCGFLTSATSCSACQPRINFD